MFALCEHASIAKVNRCAGLSLPKLANSFVWNCYRPNFLLCICLSTTHNTQCKNTCLAAHRQPLTHEGRPAALHPRLIATIQRQWPQPWMRKNNPFSCNFEYPYICNYVCMYVATYVQLMWRICSNAIKN